MAPHSESWICSKTVCGEAQTEVCHCGLFIFIVWSLSVLCTLCSVLSMFVTKLHLNLLLSRPTQPDKDLQKCANFVVISPSWSRLHVCQNIFDDDRHPALQILSKLFYAKFLQHISRWFFYILWRGLSCSLQMISVCRKESYCCMLEDNTSQCKVWSCMLSPAPPVARRASPFWPWYPSHTTWSRSPRCNQPGRLEKAEPDSQVSNPFSPINPRCYQPVFSV